MVRSNVRDGGLEEAMKIFMPWKFDKHGNVVWAHDVGLRMFVIDR